MKKRKFSFAIIDSLKLLWGRGVIFSPDFSRAKFYRFIYSHARLAVFIIAFFARFFCFRKKGGEVIFDVKPYNSRVKVMY